MMATRQPPGTIDGVLVVDKPEGPTSHDVVTWARRALGTRAVGHTGTLDPMATGVLVLVVGRATRLAQFYAGAEKGYDATIRLGLATDTWDRTGTPADGSPFQGPLPDAAAVGAAIGGFLGPSDQLPPPYSAKRVAGVRAHELARKGRDAGVAPARVVLHEVEVVTAALPLVRVRVRCSAGYYVRALAHELGRRLGCGACLDALRRTSNGEFTEREAATIDAIERGPGGAAARVVPMERLLPHLPAVLLSAGDAAKAGHGNEVPAGEGDWLLRGGRPAAVRLLAPDGTLLAIAAPGAAPGVLHPSIVLK
jgi:tRNA pseudouridine55 synthase